MARKFNLGKQGEQLLNDEWHALFMSLKYLNYERYKNIEDVFQERQTEIPSNALRFTLEEGVRKIESYQPAREDKWEPLFEGFYHPANTEKPQTTDDVVPYQLCIDPLTGAIMYWDSANLCWAIAKADLYTGEANVFNGLNFQFIANLKKAGETYPVPYVAYGKLFSEGYPVQRDDFENVNDCALKFNKPSPSWVHINASKLIRIDQRLIYVAAGKNTKYYGYINISPRQTEFYSFNASTKVGRLLIKNVDYYEVVGGIQLKNPILHKYIYALSYVFDETPYINGEVLIRKDVVTDKNQIYVGETSDRVSLFLDGLALEEKDEYSQDIFTYNRVDGTISFADTDDADVINNMQMTNLIFPHRSDEFSIAANAPTTDVAIYKDKVSIKVPSGTNINSYKNPIVFCSGLGLRHTTIFGSGDIVIGKNNSIVINNFYVAPEETYKGYVADMGDSFVCQGQLIDGGIIEHKDISEDKLYVVFVNGILMTPTNGDIMVSEGQIKITDAENSRFDVLEYLVFEIDNADDNKIGLVFDDTISHYSIRIDDGGDKSIYDNCNTAIVYMEMPNYKGILLDEKALLKPINPIEGHYKGNQVIKSMDDWGNYQYYLYDYTEQEPVLLDEDLALEIERSVGFYANNGSIHLLGDNELFEGGELTYYAYNFANTVDEVMITGYKNNLVIPVGEGTTTYHGQAKRLEEWMANCNSCTTYINGIMHECKEEKIVEGITRSYSITYPKLKMNFNKNYYKFDGVQEKDIDNEMTLVLDVLYTKYKDVPVEAIKLTEEIKLANNHVYQIKDIFKTSVLLKEAIDLAKYINEEMTKERTSYIIESIEKDEFLAAEKDNIYLETGTVKQHPQIYKLAADAVQTDFILVPGRNHVFLNGVLLLEDEFCKFDKDKVLFNTDVCGLQHLPDRIRMLQQMPEHLKRVKARDEFKTDYDYYKELLKDPQVLRIIEDQMYYIPTTSRDSIIVEKRPDLSIKTITYDIKDVSYNTFTFHADYYDLADSLLESQDLIKFYINGVYYEGTYTKTADGKGFILKDFLNSLGVDELEKYFVLNPEVKEQWEKDNGRRYKKNDKITIEWR